MAIPPPDRKAFPGSVKSPTRTGGTKTPKPIRGGRQRTTERPWAFLEDTGSPMPAGTSATGRDPYELTPRERERRARWPAPPPGRTGGTRTQGPFTAPDLMPLNTVLWRDFEWADGTVADFTLGDAIDVGWFDEPPTINEFTAKRADIYAWLRGEGLEDDERTLEEILAGLGGFGGGGAGAPVYVAPDPDQVREMVKAYVIATTGTSHENVIDKGVNSYMEAHRKSFDLRETQEVDPVTAMKLAVRDTQEYKVVQTLRPESVDEMDWVPRRQAGLAQMGVSQATAERVGIEQARVGGSDRALVAAGERAAFSETGRMLDTQRQAIKQAVGTVAGLIY